MGHHKKGQKIILVEDDPIQRKLWVDTLRKVTDIYRTFIVMPFASGEEALQSIEASNGIGLVIADLDLGPTNMSGLDLYRSIKYGLGKQVPCMLTSAHVSELHGITEPNIHILAKPFEPEDAKAEVFKMIEERLTDIRWLYMESNVEDIKSMLIKHIDREENLISNKIVSWISSKFKKKVGA